MATLKTGSLETGAARTASSPPAAPTTPPPGSPTEGDKDHVMKYRHVVVRRTGGPEVMQIVEDELPAPISGQVLVKILAADVGFSDVNIRRGRYPGGPRPPFTPGYAIAGVVERLGPDAPGLEAGQAVAALTFYGGYSQYIVLPAKELYPVPAGVDPGEAVTLVFNYVAAYQMLHRVAHVAAGQRILVHGAAGGLGTAFLELGHLGGLKMYGTASKPKHGLVQRLGATPLIIAPRTSFSASQPSPGVPGGRGV